jgi:ABC-2 type transport system permease protein
VSEIPRHQIVNIRGASMRAVYIIWYRDLIRYWRDRWRLIASLGQPFLFLVIFGVGLNSSLSGATRGVGLLPQSSLSYTQFIFPGVMGMAVLFTAIFSAMSIVWDREFGFLKEVLVAPIDRSAVAVGKALGGSTQAMIQGLIMLVFAPLVGVRLTPLTVVELVPLLFILAFAVTSLGVAIASHLRSMQGFQVVMNFLLMPMFFLSGALFPLNRLPSWMTVLTRIDPVAYGIGPVRWTVLHGAGLPAPVAGRLSALAIGGHVLSIPVEVAILLGFGAVFLVVGIHGFQVRD